MRIISKEALQALRERFPKGTRVELVQMDDFQAPPVGTKGTVRGVDDTGNILVVWDNGSGLNVVYGVDICRRLDSVKIICYGDTKVWDSRTEAIAFYLEAMEMCEGSERERYTNLLLQLMDGKRECEDNIDD